MLQEKQFYIAPEASLLVIRFEENFLDSAGTSIDPITNDGDPLGIFGTPDFIPDIF